MCMTTEQAIERQAEQANAAGAIEQALANQPQIVSGLTKIGESHLGDVRVDLYGDVHHFKHGVDIDLEDIALAGTQVSLRTMVGMKRWIEIENDLKAQIERNL
ncbi:hypothetical protein KMC50_gp37 [Ralstonia phage Claudette]|uniref:Uncharacterized protein n=2 Tax=Gervaisevirus claudettte TaxID=2846041 RepID=A0A7G5B872_9CAUD|nr:hypothetical protein KMC50_gp37 [Ralstonia phage Claudette]QMV32495.1 hypothetical protein 20A_00046 [Ralstonia phage Alix]QMV32744.1 hypothetical protein 20Ca_00037 [Ralstonia phage Claudette]